MKKIKLILSFIIIPVLLILLTPGCATQQKNIVKDIKDLPISFSDDQKINPNDIFIEYEQDSPDSTIKDNYICYNKENHSKIAKRIIASKQNLAAGKIIVEKYNVLIDQIKMGNDLYKLEQEKTYKYQEITKEQEETIDKMKTRKEIEDQITKYGLIIISVGVIFLAL